MGTRSGSRKPGSRKGGHIAVSKSPTKTQQAQLVTRQTSFEISGGPIPSPEILKGYGQIDPSFPSRIVKMAEEEQAHRHDMEKRSIEAQVDDLKQDRTEARLGQWLGLTIGLVAIIGGIVAALMDKQVTGSIIGGGGVIGLVAVFVMGRHNVKNTDASSED